MNIKSSAELRNNYRKVADFCIKSNEPVFLTNNGEGELVVMSIEAYNKQQQSLKIQKDLLRIETEKATGHASYSPASEVLGEMRKIIESARVANRE
ncbi:MAG: type II toxin-antitoxin system Phd/YefM family antitoxin [Clostridiales bacterium]|nr:type II toxin-antitoxin system Phd/YefM family antitoxin [Clostridiales bacterium]